MNDQGNGLIDIRGIMDRILHRYPFLLVDKVLELEVPSSITALKNVTMNEPFFQGHFPGLPIMPGVLILEALAQAGAILLSESMADDRSDKVFMFSGIDKARFRSPVQPGDQLILRCTEVKNKFNIWKMKGSAEVNGNIVVDAILSAAVVDQKEL